MWPYILSFIFTLFLSYLADKTFYKQPKVCWVMLSLIVVNMTLWLGLRDFGIGIDTTVYVQSYFDIASSIKKFSDVLKLEGYDYGYLLIAFIASKFSSNAQSLLVFTELFIISLTVISAYRYKKLLSISIMTFMFFYCFIFVAHSINLMRQYCAMSILLLSFSYLIEKKWITFILLYIASYYFHSSSIYFIFIPAIYHVSRIDNKKTRNLVVFLTVIGIYIVYTSFFMILKVVGNINLVSEIYIDRYDTSTFGTMQGFSIVLTIYQLFTIFFIYMAYREKVIKVHNFYFILGLYLFYLTSYQLGYVSHYLERLSHYVNIIFVVYLSYIFRFKRIHFIYKSVIVLFCVYFWWQLLVIYNGGDIYPYTSKILGILK